MAAPIQFYFDLLSTYSYIAVHKIDALAERYGRSVAWNAISIGHIFQAVGITPPPQIPEKFKYNGIDLARSCAFAGLPFRMPAVFPFDAKLSRYVFWSLTARDPMLARTFVRAAMSRAFGEGGSIVTLAELADACRHIPDLEAGVIEQAAADPAAKRAVVAAMDRARADGMIGAPFMVLDGEPFWGADRLDQLERRLAEKH